MDNIPGTNIFAPVVPFTATDEYPTHDEKYGKGGYRAVADIAARDAIPAARRSLGMVVRTMDTNINWILTGGLTDSDWVEESLDGGTF